MSTTQRGHTQKLWGKIVMCLTSCVVHLDIMESLSMDACVSNDSWPSMGTSHVPYTDNGMNFRGVDNAIQNMYNKIEHQMYQRYYPLKQISWYFNTLLASPQGGAWERLIRSVCRLLSALPKDHKTLQSIAMFFAPCYLALKESSMHACLLL